MLVTDPFVVYAEHHPSKLALVSQTDKLTFSQLQKNAFCIADKLNDCAREKRSNKLLVGVLLENSCEFVEFFLACAISGHTVVILDTKWAYGQLRDVIKLYPIDLLVVNNVESANYFRSYSLNVIDLSINASCNYFCDGISLCKSPEMIEDNPDLFVGFTSGTTSFPKGFIRKHQTWIESFIASGQVFNTNSSEKILAPGPLCHGLTLYGAIEGLTAGATVFLMKDFEVADVVEIVRENNISTMIVVPTMLKKIINTIKNTDFFPQVNKIITSGSKLETALLNKTKSVFPNTKLYEYYGASELGFVTVHDAFSAQPADSVGRSFYGVDIEIRDDAGAVVSSGIVGTLWVRSNFTIDRYFSSDDNSGFYLRDGWATVEDQAFQDDQGYIYIVARLKQMIISGGLNIYPLEVELGLNSLPEISECCVLGLPDSYWGQIVCAAITWNDGQFLAKEELIERLATKISRFKLPKKIFILDSFSKTSSGKIVVKELQESILQGNYPELR